jgi:hypothetical protein
MSDPAVNIQDSSLASQCLALCQTLASQGRGVHFSLTIGSTFAFSLDTKDLVKVTAPKARKKQSPSTQRRNLRRRNEFLASKEAQSPAKENLNGDEKHDEVFEPKTRESKHVKNPAMSCDICGHTTKTESGLKHHNKKEHEITEQSYELSCNICEYESETEDGMKNITDQKHKDIPQLDGGIDEPFRHEESNISKNFCPLCYNDAVNLRTESEFKTHVLNNHEQMQVLKTFGKEWIEEHTQNFFYVDKKRSKIWKEFLNGHY